MLVINISLRLRTSAYAYALVKTSLRNFAKGILFAVGELCVVQYASKLSGERK